MKNPKFINHQITQIFTRKHFLERKALPKELICFSFSTGFLFVKKKKCCVNRVESRGSLFAIYFIYLYDVNLLAFNGDR